MTVSHVLPSEVWRTLLDDHARLRRLLGELEDLARRLGTDDDASRDDLARRFESVAGQLRSTLESHNETEEAVLEPLLRFLDAWGPDRVEQMMLEHVVEHCSLLAAFDNRDPAALVSAVPELARELYEHMSKEEATFLNLDVLRDDLVTTGPTS